jgi:hypothetical protein
MISYQNQSIYLNGDQIGDQIQNFPQALEAIVWQVFDLYGAPGGSRTPDQQDRNLLLYPAELLAHLHSPEES